MKRFLLVLIAIVILSAGCDSSGNTPTETSTETLKGTLPVLKVGDTWTKKGCIEGIAYDEYKLTYKVTGEEMVDRKECYALEVSGYHPTDGEVILISKIDKTTMDRIWVSITTEYEGRSLVSEHTWSYQYSEPRYPLKVGKTFEVTERVTGTIPEADNTDTYTDHETYFYAVEKIEMVTVPAGTFECFKIVKYPEHREFPLQTRWFSDETKNISVKSYHHPDADLLELISYSVSN